jgi:hypothetical protein
MEQDMNADKRERIKRCIAGFLCGCPSVLQAEVAYSIMDALEDGHLTELDGMIHIYETENADNRPREGADSMGDRPGNDNDRDMRANASGEHDG